MSRARVLVVPNQFTHYRLKVFTLLQAAIDIDVEFASDSRAHHGIPAISASELRSVHRIKTIRLGKYSFQIGLLTLLLQRWDAVVLTGDPRVISTWCAALVIRAKRSKCLFWTIGWHRPEHGLKRHIRNCFYRLANRLLIYGDGGKEIGVGQGYSAGRMTVVHNSIEPREGGDEGASAFLLHSLRGVGEAVGAVVRMTEPKRLDMLIDAAELLGARGRAISVVLAGDGPERGALTNRARIGGVELRMPGELYDSGDLRYFYEVISLTVVPQAVGLTAIQSMGFGVPVVTDDQRYAQMPEWEAIQPTVTGGYYRHGEVGDLADLIETWLDRMVSDPRTIRDACKKVIKDGWSAAEHSKRLLEGLRIELADA